MKTGDRIQTPRFCTVTIKKIFPTEAQMMAAGYTEPTHRDDQIYTVRGKSIDMYHMQFAAAVKDSVIKEILSVAPAKEQADLLRLIISTESICELDHPAMPYLDSLGQYEEGGNYRLWLCAIENIPGWYISLYDEGNGWWRFNGLLPESEKERIENGRH